MSDFCNLHVHSEGSFLDGFSKVEQIAKRARELGQRHVAITDHGEVNQHYAFQKACLAEGVKPVFGMESYWAFSIPAIREACKGKGNSGKWSGMMSHICLQAASDEGLRNLWALSSTAYDEKHFYHRPIADPELLRQYCADMYASDGCLLTALGQAVRSGDEDAARQYLGGLRDIFRERFYVELHTWQYMHPSTDEKVKWFGEWKTTVDVNAEMTMLNQVKVRLATEMGIPMVVVNDAHHAYPEHWTLKEMVWGYKNDANPDQMEGSGQKADHIMGDDELYYWMERHGVSRDVVAEAIKYSGEIGEKCNAEIKPMLRMPTFTQSEADDYQLFLAHVERGFKDRVERAGLDVERYRARLETEVKLIADKHFAGYFLVVEDVIDAARTGRWAEWVNKPGSPREPMDIGPGRGSVGGSLVAFVLGITNLDPLKYGLLFERFLTPERQGFPDIDIDFPKSKRAGIKAYTQKRWGEDHVCSICTMSRNQAKGTINDLGRALGIDHAELQEISKLVERYSQSGTEEEESSEDENLSWEEIAERGAHGLAPYVQRNPRLFDALNDLVGTIRQTGVHPAAVLISDRPLHERIPTRIKNGTLTTAFDMYAVEELGGLKMDYLALRHLDALAIARDLVFERHDIQLDYETFDETQYADPVIWTQIDEGRTTGIFQLGTPGGTDSAIEFRPRSEREVADLIAINRPGVRDAGFYAAYLRRRAGVERVTYVHPLMEQITGETYGILIYQEQLMDAAKTLAGFTLTEADALRKAVSKKNMDKVLAMKQKFRDGCLRHPPFCEPFGSDFDGGARFLQQADPVIESVWSSIEASGRYLFNKCAGQDTLVKLSGVGGGMGTMAIADMYRRLTDNRRLEGEPCWYGCTHTGYRGQCQTCRVWRQKFRDPRRGLKAWSMGDDGRLHPNRIVDVHFNGRRPVWRVTLEDGNSITTTSNHRHLTTQGWREVWSLEVGDKLLVCGEYEGQVWEPEKLRTTAADPLYAGSRLPNQDRHGVNSVGYRDGGYLALKEWTEAQEWACTEPGCVASRAAGDRIERAHLDGNRCNNDPANLAMKCASHHKQHDYRVNGRRVRGEKGYSATPTAVAAIEFAGYEDVYDLEMADPYHSWVGDNIVTHNSHAQGYSLTCCREVWMKHYYPVEMLTGFMRVDAANKEKINNFVRDARRRKIGIRPPDINSSSDTFTVVDNDIRYGLVSVTGIAEKTASKLIRHQPYRNVEDFLARGGPNKTAALNLARLGALDCFGERAKVMQEIEWYLAAKDLAPSTMGDESKLNAMVIQRFTDSDQYDIEIPDFDDPLVVYGIEQELVGSFVTVDPMADYIEIIDREAVKNPAQIRQYIPGQKLVVGGQLIKVKEHVIAKGKQAGSVMAFLGVEWQGDEYDIVAFPKAYWGYKYLLKIGAPVLLGCERTDRGVSLVELFRLDLIGKEI